MRAIFLDANVLIYYFEAHPTFGPPARHLMHQALARGFELCTSALVVAEVLTGARMTNNAELEATYQRFFESPVIRVLPFGMAAVASFVEVRLLPRVKAPDAVHLACAASYGVEVFVTHDRASTRHHVPGVAFIVDLHSELFGPVEPDPA